MTHARHNPTDFNVNNILNALDAQFGSRVETANFKLGFVTALLVDVLSNDSACKRVKTLLQHHIDEHAKKVEVS